MLLQLTLIYCCVGEMHLADDEVETKTDDKVEEVDYESEPEEEEKPKKKEVDIFIYSTTPIIPIHLFPTFTWGRCTMTYASMLLGHTLPPSSVRCLSDITLSNHILSSLPVRLLHCTSIPSSSFLHSAPLFESHVHLTSYP